MCFPVTFLLVGEPLWPMALPRAVTSQRGISNVGGASRRSQKACGMNSVTCGPGRVSLRRDTLKLGK